MRSICEDRSFLLATMLTAACVGRNHGGKEAVPTGVSTTLSRAAASCLGIIAGQATNGYPTVWALGTPKRLCTGVFVSDNTLLTAAHCLPCDGTPLTLFTNEGFFDTSIPQPANAQTSSRYRSANPAACNTDSTTPAAAGIDVAAVVFPDGTATRSSAVGVSDPGVAAAVKFVGYGFQSSTNGSSEETLVRYKNVGSNTLVPWPGQTSDRGFAVTGVALNNGSKAGASTIGQGDSGGPLFSADQTVIGIASGFADGPSATATVETLHFALFASLLSDSGKAFLAQASAMGARINSAPATACVPAP